MHELRAILLRAADCRRRGETAVLATLVALRGSHYRKPGARMLLVGDEATGVLSGGCLEGDLAERAARVASSGVPQVATYDLTSSGEALWGFGLGCSGEVEVLLERLPSEGPGPLTFVECCLERRERGALATLFRVEGEAGVALGWRTARDGRGVAESELPRPLAAALAVPLAEALEGGLARPVEIELSGVRAIFLVEPIEPPASLVLAGSGRDAVAMHDAAAAVGWEVTVVEPRGISIPPDRFSSADRILCGEVRGLGARLALAPRAAAVVMTHRYLDDLALLEELLPLPIGYLGLLGPRSRRERLLGDLRARGHALSPAERRRIFGPAGLDLGSLTPAEIALSVIAEAQAVLSGRCGRSLAILAEDEMVSALAPR